MTHDTGTKTGLLCPVKNDKCRELMDKHGISIAAAFVPFSHSRNKDEKHRSLNWTVSLLVEGVLKLQTDYSAGIAHCPGYEQHGKWPQPQIIAHETEQGTKAKFIPSLDKCTGTVPILPDGADVLSSLLLDSEVLEYRSFEDWAASFGYDSDSRKAEAIYNDCMKIALRIKQAIPQDAMTELREAFDEEGL